MDEDKLNHCLAVSKKMVEIGKNNNLNEQELEDLFLLGFNHDIGYGIGNIEDHCIKGGLLLKRNGYKYWQEVYYHGTPNCKYQSKFLTILNIADKSIDKYGNDVGFKKRLEDILTRYGNDSIQYKDAKLLIEELKNKEILWKKE